MPTTFYAKSQYYSPSLDLQVTLTYILMAPWTLFLGPLLALTPGIAFGLVMITRRIRRAATTRREAPVTVGQQITPRLDLILLPAVWMVAVFGLYAIRLPVAYQHGRYLMPLIPFLCIYGLHGTANMLSGLRKVKMSKAAAVWPILIAAAALLLWIRGAGIYGDEVKFIDDEHLTTAAWLRENTPSNAKVATHDIGAMGYFSGREIVDIAGLITPQAIAYTRDQSKLLEFVRSQGAEYLAIFPDWYPSLAKSMEPYLLHRVQADYVTDAGFQNMSIYRVPPALEGQ
ncbi:MAG: hypothetical protein M1319_04955 [Chloroflexi bacterium]|nr:hypothetical protein [Chloroflexota bacterium]